MGGIISQPQFPSPTEMVTLFLPNQTQPGHQEGSSACPPRGQANQQMRPELRLGRQKSQLELQLCKKLRVWVREGDRRSGEHSDPSTFSRPSPQPEPLDW